MPACDLRLEIATGLWILSYLAQSTESLRLRAPHVLAELVICHYALNPFTEPAEDRSFNATY
jgi:hypothetical protein